MGRLKAQAGLARQSLTTEETSDYQTGGSHFKIQL
jgi:hypothetical protein